MDKASNTIPATVDEAVDQIVNRLAYHRDSKSIRKMTKDLRISRNAVHKVVP